MKHAIHHIHFVGIGGSGMCGIAEVLHNLGYKVSGSDLADSATLARLRTLGVATHVGHAAAHIAGADAVVTSTAVQQDNPEVLAARERKIPIVPQALALLPEDKRPLVMHQSGAAQIEQLRANYQAAGVQAELTPFIDDTAAAFAEADVIVCRAGASTVTEIAAVGAAAVFVPFPHAVDDHQSTNARFLVDAGGGWLVQQADLTPRGLADMLLNLERSALLERALKAKNMQKTQATREVVSACEELA